jgi:hypothetical protein
MSKECVRAVRITLVSQPPFRQLPSHDQRQRISFVMKMPFLCIIAWPTPDQFYAVVVVVVDEVAVLELNAVLVGVAVSVAVKVFVPVAVFRVLVPVAVFSVLVSVRPPPVQSVGSIHMPE